MQHQMASAFASVTTFPLVTKHSLVAPATKQHMFVPPRIAMRIIRITLVLRKAEAPRMATLKLRHRCRTMELRMAALQQTEAFL